MATRGWRMNFLRWLDERAQNQSRQLRDMLSACLISTGKGTVRWAWEKSWLFSVKSMYEHLFSGETNKPNKGIWKSKVPLFKTEGHFSLIGSPTISHGRDYYFSVHLNS
jgi:hypothetical protein